MFYELYSLFFREESPFSFLRLFSYLTFRAIFATITAFVVTLVIGEYTIRRLRELRLKNDVWEHKIVSEEHKVGVPTMGGVLILVGFLVTSLLWCNLFNGYVALTLAATLWYGLIGGADDALKLLRGNKVGLDEKRKLAGQFGFALAFALVLTIPAISPHPAEMTSLVYLPFVKHPLDSSIFSVILIMIAVTGASNAVNLADGLDGLAIVPVVFTTAVLGIFSYATGHSVFSRYLHLPYLPGTGELLVMCAAMVGAGLGFLWFNCYPAQVFMGDLGSLALGGIIGVIACCAKQELVLVIGGGLFVIEGLTTLIQRYIFVDRLGRRLFFRAPLHHDLQYRGWAETKVVVRLWIVSAIFALLALASIKVR